MQVQGKDGVTRTYAILAQDRYNVGEFEKAKREYEVAEDQQAKTARLVGDGLAALNGAGFGPDDPRAQLSRSLESAPYFDSVKRTAVEEERERHGYKVGETRP